MKQRTPARRRPQERSLAAKGARSHRADIAWGFHPAEEIIRNHPDRINQIWISAGHHTGRLEDLIQTARARGVVVKLTDRHFLSRLTGNAHHQDIVLELSPYSYIDADALLEEIHSGTLFCILDEIQDVTNLAAIIRTTEGAGVAGIFLPQRRSASITADTYRLSAGALNHVRIARVINIAQLMDRLQERGVRIICADANASRLWHEADYRGPVAILVGNEYKGVRHLLKEKSDERVRIPMLGKVQSLNVHVAAAVLLYEAVRQRAAKE